MKAGINGSNNSKVEWEFLAHEKGATEARAAIEVEVWELVENLVGLKEKAVVLRLVAEILLPWQVETVQAAAEAEETEKAIEAAKEEIISIAAEKAIIEESVVELIQAVEEATTKKIETGKGTVEEVLATEPTQEVKQAMQEVKQALIAAKLKELEAKKAAE